LAACLLTLASILQPGTASAGLGSSCPTGRYLAEYYGNGSLSGPAVFSRCDGAIDNDWGRGGPGGGVGPDDFSVRWSGRHSFAGATYTFTATADDGIRVRLDGEVIIDAWYDQSASTYSAVRSIDAGEHTITVEYYERGGDAVARLGWTGGGGGGQTPVIAAAGDIACAPDAWDFNGGFGTATTCRQMSTSDLLLGRELAAVLVLGDIQYEDGALWRFQASYDPSWGRVRSITRPVPGNHEYQTPGASGYYTYFGGAAGSPAEGYYSFDVGAWHLVALNSNCSAVGCFASSRQEQWLREDLAAHRAQCTLAYTHHPRYSSGQHSDTVEIAPLFQALYDFDADVLLSGHDHDYERIAPSNPFDGADSGRGIRQFVVGTGGKALRPFGRIDSQSEARSSDAFGVLELTLRPAGYDWRFVAAAGSSFADSGSASCH